MINLLKKKTLCENKYSWEVDQGWRAITDFFRAWEQLDHTIAKRASDVTTQTDSDKQTEMVFLKHFPKQAMFLKHFHKTKTSPRFFPFLSEYADVRGVVFICILFLDLARFAIQEGIPVKTLGFGPSDPYRAGAYFRYR